MILYLERVIQIVSLLDMSWTYARIPFVHQDEERFTPIKGSRYGLAIELRPLGAV